MTRMDGASIPVHKKLTKSLHRVVQNAAQFWILVNKTLQLLLHHLLNNFEMAKLNHFISLELGCKLFQKYICEFKMFPSIQRSTFLNMCQCKYKYSTNLTIYE